MYGNLMPATNLQFCLSPTCGPTAGTQYRVEGRSELEGRLVLLIIRIARGRVNQVKRAPLSQAHPPHVTTGTA
jgi:hypothetical protein